MIGNIFISSALVVVVIFSTSALFKSLSDIKEAKEIQEHYEIVKDIKTLLAKQYNKNVEEITRDDIIANLPKGTNWEKVLLLDRRKDSNLSNKEFIDENANIVINKDEKLKILALKAKLKDIVDVNNLVLEEKIYKINIGINVQNIISQDKDFEDRMNRVINYLSTEILYSGKAVEETLTSALSDKAFFVYDKIYIDDNTTDTQKTAFIKEKLKKRLEKNEDSVQSRLYEKIKGKL